MGRSTLRVRSFFLPVILVLWTSAVASWAAPQYKVLHAFSGPDGALLYSGLAFDKKGNVYGVSNRGGAQGYGTVFKLKRQPDGSWSVKVLRNFSNGDPSGYNPSGTPVFDAAGSLYGTAQLGGAHNAGTVFQMTPSPSGWGRCPVRS